MVHKTPGLYLHIPFCLSKCSYCDFFSVTSLDLVPDFRRYLATEIALAHSEFNGFDTLYIGGGTPSVLQSKILQEILQTIRDHFVLNSDSEITLEVNPADLNSSFLQSVHLFGVNRLNLGIQSFNQDTLNFLGRRHSVEQAISAIRLCREAGFDNVGIDLIYGIPGQTLNSWLETLVQAITLAPEHISCYQLTLEPKTPLGRRFAKGEFSLLEEDLEFEFFMKTSQTLEDSGYIHYEVSNFCIDWKYASRHNQKYWDHSPYLGLGPSAHSFFGGQRWWNHRSLTDYIQCLKSGQTPLQGMETLTVEQLQLEALYLGLRTQKGICLEDFSKKYLWDLLGEKGEAVNRLQDGGYLTHQGGFLRPTRKGLAVADRLALI